MSTHITVKPQAEHHDPGTPKWMQVRGRVLDLIEARKIAVGGRLPSDSELVEMTGFSLQPVVRAMQELERRGVVIRRPGAATVLRSARPRLDDSAFSFSHSARNQSVSTMTTRVVELAQRPIRRDIEFEHEVHALRALGLAPRAEVLVIARLRLFDGVPHVLQRSYLNPANHAADFLASWDFARDSLIAALNAEGYSSLQRDAKIAARKTTSVERRYFGKKAEIVLDVRQEMRARRDNRGSMTIEYFVGTYFDWEYLVNNRPPAEAET